MSLWHPPEETRKRLDEVAAKSANQAPSLRASLFERGEEVWAYEAGDVAQQYRIGSITKTFTAVVVLRLRDEGLIDLNDSIGRHVHDTPFGEASIRDLLAHRSGMTAEPAGPWWERTPGQEWSALAAGNHDAAQVFDGGSGYHYSNLGYGLLGELVARLRGRAWFDVVRDELLSPLGLRGTTYQPGADVAGGTSRNPITGELQREPAQDTRAMAAAGQLWSTTADLARWGHVLSGGEPSVLSSESLQEMRTTHSADVNEQHRGAYGLGLRLRWRSSGALVGHTGSMPGFLAGLFVDPALDFGGVVLANCTTGLDTERIVAELLAASGYDGADPVGLPRPIETSDAVRELEGEWYWGNTELRLRGDAAGFELGSKAEGRAHFRPAGEDCFVGTDEYWNGETLTVVRGPNGEVSHLEVVTFILTRLPYDGRAPIPGGAPLPLG